MSIVLSSITVGIFIANEGVNYDTKKTMSPELTAKKYKHEEKLNHLKNLLIKDFTDSSTINLGNYKLISNHEKKQLFDENRSLLEVYMNSKQGEIEIGDTIPFLYLDSNLEKGLIFIKKAKGSNIVYTINNDNGNWSIASKKELDGKIIKPEDAGLSSK